MERVGVKRRCGGGAGASKDSTLARSSLVRPLAPRTAVIRAHLALCTASRPFAPPRAPSHRLAPLVRTPLRRRRPARRRCHRTPRRRCHRAPRRVAVAPLVRAMPRSAALSDASTCPLRAIRAIDAPCVPSLRPLRPLRRFLAPCAPSTPSMRPPCPPRALHALYAPSTRSAALCRPLPSSPTPPHALSAPLRAVREVRALSTWRTRRTRSRCRPMAP
ncbi:hypothetical protein DENSPDRAFT_886595 [Dentipellis sp. KUC8613]|nr:hypothetical protein DENSPDRAFT_886595 [Dentipellis sp. KUC8613]